MPFTSIDGWTENIRVKEANGVKFYEVAIWEDTHSIHLYAFPNEYAKEGAAYEIQYLRPDLSTEEIVGYRERFCIKKFEGMPVEWSDRGEFVLNAFTEFAKILVERHPEASHNLIWFGHGSHYGELFENHLDKTQANQLLANWHTMLGRKLGFVDMGETCNKGTFPNLEMVYQHADYYIASDQAVGCTTSDSGSWEAYIRADAGYNYPRLLWMYTDMKDALIERVELRRLRYEDSRNNIVNARSMESLYLYSCSEFGKYKDDLAAFMRSQSPDGSWFTVGLQEDMITDIRRAMAADGTPQLLQRFDSIIIHSVDTKDMVSWSYEGNGMMWLVEGSR